jgi:hypothetical protein
MMLASGTFSQLIKTGDQEFSNTTSGNGWWNTQNNQWVSSNVPYLSGVVYGAFSTNNNDYFIGNIKSAQTFQSNGISFISQSNPLSPLSSFNPDGSETSISVSSGVLYQSGAINPTTQKNTTTTILGGQFRLPGNIQNVAIYDNGTWSGVQGADWQGKVSTMAVNNNLLYVGGRFSGANSNNLAIFDLSNKSLSLVPEVKTHDGSPANVNIIRHIPTQNSMVIGGNFSTVGALACSTICSLHVSTLQWSTLGSGLVGEVMDVQLINSKLVASGNLTLNNSPLPIAEFDFEKQTWGPFGTANLPGPSQMISYDNVTNHLYISGHSTENDAVYLRVWDGQQFLEPKHELGPGSIISSLGMFPLVANESTSSSQNILLASGFINLGTLGNVSAAFFDGDKWIPYLVASSSEGGNVSSMSSIFFLDQPFIAPFIKKYLPTPIVILVAIAISLAIVFLIVLGAMLIVHFKRKRDSKVNPQSNPASYYGKPPRTPESLLATLKDTSSNDNDSDKGDGAEKNPRLEPENQQLYNLSKAISSEHLHEQIPMQFNAMNGVTAMTTARAAPATTTTHARSVPQQNQSYNTNSYDNTTMNNNDMNSGAFSNYTSGPGAATGAAASYYNSDVVNPASDAAGFGATASYYGSEIAAPAPTAVSYAVRPDSYVRPISEMQRDSNTNSFYNNEYTKAASNTEMSEIPARYSSYNPFRNSEIGMMASGGAGIAGAVAVAGATKTKDDSKQSNNSRGISTENNTSSSSNFSHHPQGQTVSYGNIAPPLTTSSLASNSPTPKTDQWTNAAVEAAPEKMKWAFMPSSNEAFVSSTAPAIAIHHPDENTTRNNHQQEQSYLSPVPSSSTSSFNISNSANAANNVRWTNNNMDAAVGIATVEPVSTRDSTFDLYYPSSTSSNPSLLNAVHTSEGFSSDPDIVRWTTAPSATANMSIATVTPVEPSERYEVKRGSGGRSQYQASLSSLAWPQDEDDHEDSYEAIGTSAIAGAAGTSAIAGTASSSTTGVSAISSPSVTGAAYGATGTCLTGLTGTHSTPNTIGAGVAASTEYESFKDNNTLLVRQESTASDDKGINTNAFRLSDAGSLPPIDTNTFAFNTHSPNEDSMSPDSAVRWKTTNVGSPIETAYVPLVLEPATATVTRRSTNERDTDFVFQSYFNPKPVEANKPVDQHVYKNNDSGKSMYKPIINTTIDHPIVTINTPAITTTLVEDHPIVTINTPTITTTLVEDHTDEPVGRKSEAIDDIIASRDLDALSILIEDENPLPSQMSQLASKVSLQQLEQQQESNDLSPVPTNTRSTPSPSGPGAMEGRAASKRMVEEYLNSRRKSSAIDDGKRSKYKSDFKSIMEAAIMNNTASEIATEDKPHLYYAKFDFSAREHGELGFEKADPIIVIDSSDDIWWMGYKADSK